MNLTLIINKQASERIKNNTFCILDKKTRKIRNIKCIDDYLYGNIYYINNDNCEYIEPEENCICYKADRNIQLQPE